MHEDESELQRTKTYGATPETPETPELMANCAETERNVTSVLHAALDRLDLEEAALRKCEGLLARLRFSRETSDSESPADPTSPLRRPPSGTIAAPSSADSRKRRDLLLE